MNFVDIFIPLPELVTKASQLIVEYTRDHLKGDVEKKKCFFSDKISTSLLQLFSLGYCHNGGRKM